MRRAAAVVIALLAAGCENTAIEGVHAELSAQGRNGLTGEVVTDTANGGTVTTPASEQDPTVYRSDGMKVEIEFAALNLQLISVDPCPSVAALLGRAGGFLLGDAVAHGSEIETGSSALHLIGEPIALGRLDLKPGTYCSVTLEIGPGSDPLPDYAALAAAQDPPILLRNVTTTDTHGIGLNLSACFYYPSQGATREAAYNQATHTCLANLRAIRAPVAIEVPLEEPVTVDADNRRLAATLSVRHDRWFEGIPMDLAGEPTGTGGQVRRWSAENPNPTRPFPDKDVVPDTDPKQQCSLDASCAAEFQEFVDALVANVTDPDNFELRLAAD